MGAPWNLSHMRHYKVDFVSRSYGNLQYTSHGGLNTVKCCILPGWLIFSDAICLWYFRGYYLLRTGIEVALPFLYKQSI